MTERRPVSAHPSPEASLPATATRAPTPAPVRAILWMLLASALFALMALFSRLSAGAAPWTEVAFARAFFGLVVAAGVARFRGLPLVVQDQKRAWGRSLCGTTSMLCTFYVYGAPDLPLGDAAALGATAPIFLAILAPFVLGEKSGRAGLLATPLAFLGVMLVVQPKLQIAGHLALISTTGALFSAIAMLFLRRLGPYESPEAVATHFSAVATVISFFVAIPTFHRPDATGFLALAGTGISAGLGQLAMTRAYALDHAARVGTVGYVGVVITQLLGVFVLDERPGVGQVLGTGLVITAGVLLAWSAVRRGPPSPRPDQTEAPR